MPVEIIDRGKPFVFLRTVEYRAFERFFVSEVVLPVLVVSEKREIDVTGYYCAL